MISFSEARTIAREHLNAREAAGGVEVALMDEQTLEKDFGWILFYDSKQYLATRRFRDKLAGNAPMIVEKSNGALHVTGTAMPIEYYVAQFRKYGTPNPIPVRLPSE